MPNRLNLLIGILCFGLGPYFAPQHALAEAKFMIEIDVHGQRIEGKPLYWSDARVQLMLRDGQLFDFRSRDARKFKKTSTQFRSYTAGELSSRLSAELGPQFEITGTGHYLVAHPRGQRDHWAKRFESLYRSFVFYFSVRGLKIRDPEFPLIAVVWPTREEFLKNAAQRDTPIGSNVLGYYSSKSNRVNMYDISTNLSDKDWKQNADTIIHEVTHQTAFNTGVHTRFANTPLWVAEGLGTLFEAPGIYDSQSHRNKRDRVNRGRLTAYRAFVKRNGGNALAEMISSDRFFRQDTDGGYALAWAFTFYLVETRPSLYAKYLSRTAARKVGGAYPSKERMADFTAVFGKNLPLLEAQFRRSMEPDQLPM